MEYQCFPYPSSLCKSNRARWFLVTIITMMTILMEMIVTLPTAASAPTIAPMLLLSGGAVVLSEGDVINTKGK